MEADALAAHQARFRSIRERWERQGVLAALFAVLEAYTVPARCLDPEAAIFTDLRHLGECQENALTAPAGGGGNVRGFYPGAPGRR